MTELMTAEQRALAAVAGIGARIRVEETLGAPADHAFVWRANLSVSLSAVRVTGAYFVNDDDLDGYGRTRDEALTALVDHLGAVESAVLERGEWDELAESPRWLFQEIAWNGETLAPTGRTQANGVNTVSYTLGLAPTRDGAA